jgi:hypothetical protein
MTGEERCDVLEARLNAQRELMDERDRRYDERFKATDERTNLALVSSEKAVAKAEIATEKRFDAVNEFRGQLKDQAATLMPRAEVDTRFNALAEKIESIKTGSVVQSRWTFDKVIMVAIAIVGWALLLLRTRP